MNPPNSTGTAFSRYRWVICSLLFFSTTVNYLDRQVIGYLKEFFCTATAAGGFGWTNTDFANLTSAFTGFYALMTIFAGRLIDKIGTKIGLALALVIWSIFGIANAFVGSMVQMHMIVRSLFAIGEAGNFPASIKTVAEWFPKRERALATAIFNAGSNGGAMVAALFVPWCMIHYGDALGWKMAFILTGAGGLVWLIFWFWLYDPPNKQKRLSKAEYDYIHIDDEVAVDAQTGDKTNKSSFGNLFSFKGRASRSEFWGTTIMINILCLCCYFFCGFITPVMNLAGWSSTLISFVVDPFLLVVGVTGTWILLALNVRRCHDLGKSGWFVLVGFIPFVGSIVLLIALGFFKGDSGLNKFGDERRPEILGYRQAWSFFVGKFMTDGIWWFYLFWLPDYLHKQFAMTKAQIMLPTFIVYGVAIVGSIYGGSIPMMLIKRGMAVYKARMTTMFIIALCPLAVLLTQYFGDVNHFGSSAATLAVAMICIGATAHQAWSANLFTTVSDMFPKKAVGSVTGIGTAAGGIGGVIIQKIAGHLTDLFKDTPQTAYLIMFVICALSYLIAWTLMKALVPRHAPITDL